MLDVARREWSAEMLDACGIRRDMLPEVFESPAVCAARVGRGGGSDRAARPARRSWPGPATRRPVRWAWASRAPGACQRDDRHVRRRVRGDRAAGARSQGPHPHVLPRHSRPLARHGRDAGGGTVAAVASRSVGHRLRRCGVRTDDRRGRRRAGRCRWRAVGAVSDGRAHAAYAIRTCAARCVGLAASHTRGARHPRRAGGRGVQPARHVRHLR